MINRLSIMENNRLFFEFMYETYREKKNQLLEIQALGKIYRGLSTTSKTGEESEDGEYKMEKF